MSYEMFSCPKKKDRAKARPQNPLTIISVTETNIFEECACITVSHERSLYVTKDFIVTHNTSAMLQTAYNNAFVARKRVVIFSLEMTKDELLEKLYCFHVGIDSDTWVKMSSQTKLREIQIFTAYIISNRIELIIDDECTNILTIANRAKALSSEKHVDLFCIDYIQLIDCSLVNRNKSDEIEMIMNVMKKQVASKLKSIVIALSQMGKKIEQENYRLPILADLLNGGAIEATSTSVYFLHAVSTAVRHYFDEDGHIPNNGETLFIAQKARYGKKGILKTWFAGGMNKFVTTHEEFIKTQEEVREKCQHFLKN
jgi:replicative DNA helicase